MRANIEFTKVQFSIDYMNYSLLYKLKFVKKKKKTVKYTQKDSFVFDF